MRSCIPRQKIIELVEYMGLDPNDVRHIVVDPRQMTMEVYELDVEGNKVLNSSRDDVLTKDVIFPLVEDEITW